MLSYLAILEGIMSVAEKAISVVAKTTTEFKAEVVLAVLGLYEVHNAAGRFDQAAMLILIGLSIYVGLKLGAK